MKLNLSVGPWLQASPVIAQILQVTTTLLFTISVIAVVAGIFIALFIVMQRYYKNFFSDEGYLTFTLPVKTGHLLGSKVISAVLWMLFVLLCTIIGVAIIAIFGSSAPLSTREPWILSVSPGILLFGQSGMTWDGNPF